jgi:hypothetical protein
MASQQLQFAIALPCFPEIWLIQVTSNIEGLFSPFAKLCLPDDDLGIGSTQATLNTRTPCRLFKSCQKSRNAKTKYPSTEPQGYGEQIYL